MTPLKKIDTNKYVNYGLTGARGITKFTYDLQNNAVHAEQLFADQGRFVGEITQFDLNGVTHLWMMNNDFMESSTRQTGRVFVDVNGTLQSQAVRPRVEDYVSSASVFFSAIGANVGAGKGYFGVNESIPLEGGGYSSKPWIEVTTDLKNPANPLARTRITRDGLPGEGFMTGYNGINAYTRETPQGKKNVTGVFISETIGGRENGYYEITETNGQYDQAWERKGTVIFSSGVRIFIPVAAKEAQLSQQPQNR